MGVVGAAFAESLVDGDGDDLVVALDDDESVWSLLMSVPSSGKTGDVRLLDDITDAHLDDITAAGLLSWPK